MQLADLYIAYTLITRLSTPFNKTKAFQLGIIDEHGNVLKPLKSLKTQAEKDNWSYLDILINNIKRMLTKIPGGSNQLFVYAAAYFLLREPILKLKENSELPDDLLTERILGPAGEKYLSEALDTLLEDAPANAAGMGNVAGIGVGPKGEPGFKPHGKFAGHAVFHVDPDRYHKSIKGKKKSGRYKSYVGEDEVGQAIRQYGRTNPGKGIILSDPRSGAMTFLRRPGKYDRG